MPSDHESTSPRGPGRPKSDEPGTTVSMWLRNSEHDQLIKMAQQSETSVSALLRQLVSDKLR